MEITKDLLRFFWEEEGFLVKESGEETFLILNPGPSSQKEGLPFLLSPDEVSLISAAVVKFKPWYTLRFSKAVFALDSTIFDSFNNPKIEEVLGRKEYLKIFIVPELPVSEELKKEVADFLKTKGIDHLLKFSSILKKIIQKIDPHQKYKEPSLQLLKILKMYNLLKKEQLPLPLK